MMQNRPVFVVLTIALCATLSLGTDFRATGKPGGCLDAFEDTVDVAVQITSPRDTEEPGIVPMVVKLTNIGNVIAMVPRLDMHIQPLGQSEYSEDIPIPVGANQVVSLSLDLPEHSEETCTAWITYPQDMNHHNDTDVVIVHTGPFPGVQDDANSRVSQYLTGSIARAESRLTLAGAMSVTLYDIRGRAVLKRGMGTAVTGESSLDLRSLSPGVYIVRLNDGRSTFTRKLVVQR
jgi:hypothetical protein